MPAGAMPHLLAHQLDRALRTAALGLRLGGGNLEQADCTIAGVDADDIRERSADVDADGYGARHTGPVPVRPGHGADPCVPARRPPRCGLHPRRDQGVVISRFQRSTHFGRSLVTAAQSAVSRRFSVDSPDGSFAAVAASSFASRFTGVR